MYTDALNLFLPVKAAVQPVIRVSSLGNDLSKGSDSSRKGMKFIGYGPDGVDNLYGPSGKNLRERFTTGRIVDVYA
jgi:hypothetical protein